MVCTIIFMTAKEVWDNLISICCVGAEKHMSYEVESNQLSIKEKKDWIRKSCAPRVDEKNIVEVM